MTGLVSGEEIHFGVLRHNFVMMLFMALSVLTPASIFLPFTLQMTVICFIHLGLYSKLAIL